MADRLAIVGEAVTFTDPMGNAHPALVTAVHGVACVNLVWVSTNPTQRDPYGQQIKHESSCQLKGATTAHGNYFTFND